MNGTLYSLDLLHTGVGFVVSGLVGVLFGIFLEQAGFGSSRKLTGMFYFRDMSVLKVMFTAVVVALVGYQYLVAYGWLSPGNIFVLDTYWGAQIVGGLIFGVGFVMGGWCPGTAFVGLASLRLDALVFLVGAVLGGILFNEMYAVVQPLYEGMHAGPLYLSQTLGVGQKELVVGFAAAAVVAFALSTLIERGVAGSQAPRRGNVGANVLAAILLLAAAGGVFLLPAGPAAASQAAPAPAVAGILAEVARERDHVEPGDLADAIMANTPGLTVVDVRPAEAYAKFHLRGSVNVPLETLADAREKLPVAGRIVLCSNGTTHAAQAWVVLRQMGYTNAQVLTEGLLGFWRECLTPPSLAGVMDEAAAKAAFGLFARRRDYFLGTAMPVAARPVEAKPAETPAAFKEPGLEGRLVSTEWLVSKLGDPKVRIVDVRNKPPDYTAGHIPGAVYLNMEAIRTNIGGIPSMMVPAEDIAVTLGRLGIRGDDTVIVCADDRLMDATFFALALERVGHPSYAVLHGGMIKWLAEKRPMTTAFPKVEATKYHIARRSEEFIVDIASVKAALGDGKTRIVDVRPAPYFRGEKSDEARPGHIPGAISREFTLDLVPNAGAWKSAEVLEAEYVKLGIGKDTPVIVHCRTGHQASQTYFLLKHLLGRKNARWFDASWSGWAAQPDLPAETGPGK